MPIIDKLFHKNQKSESKKFLIVGLGNFESKYNNTRHNIGFKIVDDFAYRFDELFVMDKHADICKIKHKGRIIILLKPTTFMNFSGKAVSYWMQKEKIPLENVLVIVDDLALPFSQIRLKAKGGDGGHNGLSHINQTLGTSNYARLRYGIGNEFGKGHQIDYVLSKWDDNEIKAIDESLNFCSDIIKSFTTIGIDKTMNIYNTTPKKITEEK